MKYAVIILISFFSVSTGSAKEKVEQEIVYESTTKGEATQTLWTILKKENAFSIQGVRKETKTDLGYDLKGSLLSFEEKGQKGDLLFIEKVGPCLIIKSHQKGKDKILSHKIGNKPWIQDFTFSFQKFILQKNKTLEFYIVYPKDLSLQEMIITKEMVEELVIAGKKYKAQKAKITLTGFKKQFWKGMAWFDVESGLLVQYRANEGPRTPYTEIQVKEGKLELPLEY